MDCASDIAKRRSDRPTSRPRSPRREIPVWIRFHFPVAVSHADVRAGVLACLFRYASSNPQRQRPETKSRLFVGNLKEAKAIPFPISPSGPPLFQGYPTFYILWSRLFVESHVQNSLVRSLLVRSDSKPLLVPPAREKRFQLCLTTPDGQVPSQAAAKGQAPDGTTPRDAAHSNTRK